MGVCESENISPNILSINEEIKELSKNYSIKYTTNEKINKNYSIVDIIGEGAFGRVFIGLDKTGKKYAIKCLLKRNILKGDSLFNEIKIGVKVNHPNLLKIKEVYEDITKVYLVMEYCEGGDLFDFITNSPLGKLDDINTIQILTQILDALNYLHNEVKICHRDLKPENCLITINGQKKPIIKLIDFGTAQCLDKNTRMTGKIGTIKYMAPEIFIGSCYNEKVDLWSAGVILYNMTTGREPFFLEEKELDNPQIFYKDINFNLINNNEIKELCKLLLEKSPKKRIDARSALEKAKKIKKELLGF